MATTAEKHWETAWKRWHRVAKAAEVNWRTVRAYEENPMMVRPSSALRIERALGKKGTRR